MNRGAIDEQGQPAAVAQSRPAVRFLSICLLAILALVSPRIADAQSTPAGIVAVTPGQISTTAYTPATGGSLTSVAIDPAGNAYVLDGGLGTLTKYAASSGTPTVLIGPGSATTVTLNEPSAMVYSSVYQEIFITDTGNNRLVFVLIFSSSVSVVALKPFISVSPSTLNDPTGIFVGGPGQDVYVADTGNERVLKFDSDGDFLEVVVENPAINSTNSSSLLDYPQGLAVDSSGNVYISSLPSVGATSGGTIVEVSVGAPITLPVNGPSGNILQIPYGIAIDAADDLYISDLGTHQVIRDYIPGNNNAGDNVVAVAGNGGSSDSGDGGPATQAGLSNPLWISLDPANRILIPEGSIVREVDVTTGSLSFTGTTPQTFLLTNPTDNTKDPEVGVQIGAVSGANPTDFSITGGTCLLDPSTNFLQPSNTCSLNVAFSGPSGLATASIPFLANYDTTAGTFNSTNPAQQTILLSGTGPTGPAQTTATISATPSSPVASGTPVTLTASVNTSSGNVGSTGTVTFFDSFNGGPNQAVSSAISMSGGMASVTLSTPLVGLHDFSFVYTDTSGTYENNSSPSDSVTILPSLVSLSVSPNSVTGGASGTATGTVTLSGAAPSTGFIVALSSSNSTVASVPSSVTVPSGATSQTFPITTSAVVATTNVSITASYAYGSGTVSVASMLTVNPATTPPPVNITVNETITVSDALLFPDIVDAEPITVADSVSVIAINPPINVAAPVAYFSPSSMGFSNQTGGQIIQVSNIGSGATANLIINGMPAISGSGSAAFGISPPACTTLATSFPITLPSDGACTFTITYTAPSSGPASATLTFSDNAALTNCNVVASCTASTSSPYTQAISLNGSGTSSTAPEPPAVVTVTDNETITVTDTPTVVAGCGTVAISPAGTLSPAVAGFPYSQTFTASGASGTIAWSLSKAPFWLTVNPGTGVLSGTPPHAVTKPFNFTVTANYGNSCSASASVSLAVVAPSVKIVAGSTTVIPNSVGYSVIVKVMNAGNVPISTLTLTGATLGRAQGTLLSPTTILNTAPGATATFTVQFLAAAVKTATPALTLIGNYSAGTIRGGWKVASLSVTLAQGAFR
jgi:hypothetical protein